MTGSEAFPYTFGIEEEFFLTHPKSRALAVVVPRSLMRACRRRFGEAIAPELLWSQIEVVSPIFERHEQAMEELARLRRGVAEIAAQRLGCETPLQRVRALLDEGTSAHAQLKLYRAFRERGDAAAKAMQSVVDWLIAATMPAG